MKFKKPAATPEKALFLLTIFLSALGLLFVFEASVAEAFAEFGDQFYFLRQQAMWLGVGLCSMFICMWMPTDVWKRFSPILYLLSIFLMLLVFIPGIGREVNGAWRWIRVGGFTLQPVEVVKFAVITFFASWMEKHQKLPPFLFLTLIPVFLLFLQPDMGSALIVLSIAFGVYFLAGAPLRTFIATAVVGVLTLALLIFLSPYRMRRLMTFLDPDSDPLGASFHIRQIVIALGNGGVFGQGIGQSRQKFSYIPEASTDSIFAIIAEEIGFLGAIMLLLLFGLFLRLAYMITRKTEPGSFDHLLSIGIMIWIGMQVVLNLSSIVALVPLTGVPLPFFSYGGSSLVMILSITGILIGIGRKYNKKIS